MTVDDDNDYDRLTVMLMMMTMHWLQGVGSRNAAKVGEANPGRFADD